MRKSSILLVDDRRENIIVLTEALKGIDAEFVWTLSGNDAVKKALFDDFDLILVDVQMPGMDGYETAELIRREEKNRTIPIIFVSAVYRDDFFKIKGLESGGLDFIVKPFDESILRGKVKLFLELQAHRKLLAEKNEFLEKARRELEAVNAGLEQKVAERTDALAQKNTALREMLYQIEEEKGRITGNIKSNVDKFILPAVRRAEQAASPELAEMLSLIARRLEELTATFGRRIAAPDLNLTPREIEICGFVKEGLTTKEIAKILNINSGTVETHRNKIRKKLGISSEKINLAAHLNAL